MQKFYIKYNCDTNDETKYKNTINIMNHFYDDTILINDWFITDNYGILIIECINFFNTKIKLNKYFNIIEYKQIYNINDWLNDYEK